MYVCMYLCMYVCMYVEEPLMQTELFLALEELSGWLGNQDVRRKQ